MIGKHKVKPSGACPLGNNDGLPNMLLVTVELADNYYDVTGRITAIAPDVAKTMKTLFMS